MIKRCVEQILNLYNFIDGIMVADEEGNIEYYQTFRPDLNDLKMEKIIGKNLFDIYPTLTKENSTIHKVLKTGEPIFNQFQEIPTYTGKVIRSLNTTLPLKEGEKIVGAVDVSRYIDTPYARKNIALTFKNVQKNDLYTVDDIISNSVQMSEMKEKIIRIANTDSSVLIWGESGTGKELVAQSLHTASNRKNKKFVSQNCAAIPSTLLESILFGTTKGSFTGAENRAGIFEVANGGTIFLDEINSMGMDVQAKILKAIEEKQIKRIGGVEPILIDVKIVAAMNADPIECVKNKIIREDLFYRLSVVQIKVPPLRERQADLFFLIDYFIHEYNEKMNRDIIGIDEDVEKIFKTYRWPGNVREVKNVIEGAFNIVSSRVIQVKDLPEYLLRSTQNQFGSPNDRYSINFDKTDFSLKNEVEAFEKEIIQRAIDQTGSYVLAAQKLKLTKQALNYKLNKYGIDR